VCSGFRAQGSKQGESVLCRRTLAFALMGTSVAQVDATFGHLVPDSEEYLRGLLDTFDAKPNERGEAQNG
jgi:hypothetical protein